MTSVAYLALLNIALLYASMHIYCYVRMYAIYSIYTCLLTWKWCTVEDYMHA